MTLDTHSRYRRNAVGLRADRHGVQRQYFVHRWPRTQTLTVTEHLWTVYDRPDLLSRRSYGTEDSWWMIGEANPDVGDWSKVPLASLIRVPRYV